MGTLQDMDISPPENDEAGDDFHFPDDLEDLDSDMENNFLEDSISIVSTPKPSLRYQIWHFINLSCNPFQDYKMFNSTTSGIFVFSHRKVSFWSYLSTGLPPTQPGDF